jgi:hypothetical protein
VNCESTTLVTFAVETSVSVSGRYPSTEVALAVETNVSLMEPLTADVAFAVLTSVAS